MINLLDGTAGYGAGHLQLTSVCLRDEKGMDTLSVAAGETLELEIVARAAKATRRPNLGFALYLPGGDLAFSISALNLGARLGDVAAGEECRALFGIRMTLAPGAYGLTVIAADNHKALTEDSGVHHDTRERLGPIVVTPSALSQAFDGIGQIPSRLILNETLDS